MPRPRGDGRALAAIFLAAIALRPQLVSIGPLAPAITRDLGVDHAGLGLLTTIPLICMGLASLVVGSVVVRFGARSVMTTCLAVIVVVAVVRAGAPDLAAVLLMTLPIGAAIGLAGATLPIVVKEILAELPAVATGVYTTAIQLGSTVGAALAVPLALLLGGWREVLVAFAAAGLISVGAWLLLMPSPSRPEDDRVAPRARLRWRDPVAWLLAVLFWLTALPFYGLIAWLAAAYVELGWSSVDAGWLVSLVGLAGLPASLAVGWTADRVGSRRAYLVGSTLMLIVAMIGFVVAPALGVLWAVTGGATLGALFTLSLLLPLDVADSPVASAGLVGVMLSAGYVLTAMTPVLLGAARDVTGSFDASLWLIVIASVVLLVVSLPFSERRVARWRERSRASG